MIEDTYREHLAQASTPPNTVAGRVRVLRSLRATVGDPLTATREAVEEWWWLRGELELAAATRAADLAHARAFYRWAVVWEHRPDDPTIRLTAPKVAAGLPHPISRDDLHRLLTALPEDLRRAVCLGAYAGLRVAEVAALGWDQIDLDARRADIRGKGGKWRRVALSPLLIDSLLPEHRGDNVVRPGAPYSPAQLQRRINRAIRAAGVDATFHALRHRYGTIAYQATGDLLAVGRQMGHSSPVTTAVYAATSDEVADVIAEAVSR